MKLTRYDAIVVGAGSTGGVLAARLSDDPARQVLLLEAGRDFPDAQLPGFVSMEASGPALPEFDWGTRAEPLPSGRRPLLLRGKLVGGGSMINGCIAVRPRPSDLDAWARAGASGWGWQEAQASYEAVERQVPIRQYPEAGWLPFHQVAVQGFLDLGFRFAPNIDASDAWDGVVGPWRHNRVNGVKQGTLVTYLRDARARPNLTIRPNVLVDTVVLEGTRVTGVRIVDASGRRVTEEADLVVLCAGTYGSPPILLRSGIGPASELGALGIRPLVDLPVGRRLMDHAQASVWIQADPAICRVGAPQRAVVVRGDGWYGVPRPIDDERGLASLAVCLASTDGDGTITLASTEPDAQPVVRSRLHERASDPALRRGWEVARELLDTPAFRAAHATLRAPQDFDELVRDRLASGFHGAGGCCIGEVVDPALRVKGTTGLLVADASVFPRNVSNNPNLTCFMIGERLASMLGAPPRASRGATSTPTADPINP